MYKAIIIDDEPWTIIDIEKTFSLEDMGFEIVGSYRTPQKALPAIISKKPDLVITDIRMPGMTGMELIKSVRSQKITVNSLLSVVTVTFLMHRRQFLTALPDIV